MHQHEFHMMKSALSAIVWFLLFASIHAADSDTKDDDNAVVTAGDVNAANDEIDNVANDKNDNAINDDNANVMTGIKVNISNVSKDNVTNTHKDNVTNVDKGNVTNINKDNVTNINKDNVTNTDKDNITNSDKGIITETKVDITKGNNTILTAGDETIPTSEPETTPTPASTSTSEPVINSGDASIINGRSNKNNIATAGNGIFDVSGVNIATSEPETTTTTSKPIIDIHNNSKEACKHQLNVCVTEKKLTYKALSCSDIKSLGDCLTNVYNTTQCTQKDYDKYVSYYCLLDKIGNASGRFDVDCIHLLRDKGEFDLTQEGTTPEQYFCDLYSSKAFKDKILKQCNHMDKDIKLLNDVACGKADGRSGGHTLNTLCSGWSYILIAFGALMLQIMAR